jgi:predicted SprT family Zn-dependent metalloprotease
MPTSPTVSSYDIWEKAFDFYNRALFERTLGQKLDPVIFTFTRKSRMMGMASKQRWISNDGQDRLIDEISLNPAYFQGQNVVEVLQTLVHEMVHIWQFHYGKTSARTYHNKQWGDTMQSIGLMPSNTGKPGGRRTGQQMMDYVIANGRFEKVTEKLFQKQFMMPFLDRAFLWKANAIPDKPSIYTEDGAEVTDTELAHLTEGVAIQVNSIPPQPVKPQSQSKLKYQCSGCRSAVWGKPSLRLLCIICDIELSPVR